MWKKIYRVVHSMLALSIIIYIIFLCYNYKVKNIDSAYIHNKSSFKTNREPSFLSDFKLVDENGKNIDLNIFSGKKVIINYWKYNCEKCLSEIENIDYLYQLSLERPDLVVLRVSDLALKNDTLSVVKDKKLREPILFDDNLKSLALAMKSNDEKHYPIQFYVNSNGTLNETVTKVLSKEEMEDKLAKLR